MKRLRKLLLAILLLSVVTSMEAQKFENLANTPQMGWNSWNKFACDINEEKIVGVIDAMVTSGLRDAGYIYVNLDDCWHGDRDKDGFIQCDPERFPHGIKWLADYAHSKGLKLGIYSDCGFQTCAGELGSLGHEYQDALQYARWGIDYLKLDWCNTPDMNPIGSYRLMRDALYATGRPIFLSICEWGSNNPWLWASEIGHSWRTTGDIGCLFKEKTGLDKPTGWHPLTVVDCMNRNDTLRQYAGPGHWNDPDMLEVGNGMTENEDRAHFTMWCMMASPLLLGNDLRTMSEATKTILLNKDMIAINQDKLGVQGLHYCDENGLAFWFKPLENGDWAFTMLNLSDQDITYDINWQHFNFTDDAVSKKSTGFDKQVYKVYNLWTHKMEGKTSLKDKTERTVTVPSCDVISYRLVL